MLKICGWVRACSSEKGHLPGFSAHQPERQNLSARQAIHNNREYSQPHLYFYSVHQIESEIRFFPSKCSTATFLIPGQQNVHMWRVTSGSSILISFHWLQRSKSSVSLFYFMGRQKLEPVTNYRARSTFFRWMALALKNWRASSLWEALQIPISLRHSSIARYKVQARI